MKRTRRVNALEARKWLFANPRKECAGLEAEKEYYEGFGKKKHYEWKNCNCDFPLGETTVPLRRKNGDLALGRHVLDWTFLVGNNWIGIPDPENWEYLELEE